MVQQGRRLTLAKPLPSPICVLSIDATQLLAAMIFRLTRQSVSHSFVIPSGSVGTPTFG